MMASSFISNYQPPIFKSPTCFFDPSTCQYQNFSIPEKIVYYIAKNGTNGETFQKLIETCKYFFAMNPVIVVFALCCFNDKWYAYFDMNLECEVGFKYDQPINFKIWVTFYIDFYGNASQLIPLIYKNDATGVHLRNESLKFDQFLFLAGNAENLFMRSQVVKYENDEIVQLEDIVKNLPKLESLTFESSFDGSDVDLNTIKKFMEIQHLKNISKFKFCNVSEALNVEEMFNLIIENRHIEVDLCYREEISDECKELVREYSNRLKNEDGCNSTIKFDGMISEIQTSSSDDDSSDTSFDSTDDDDDVSSDADENEIHFRRHQSCPDLT